MKLRDEAKFCEGCGKEVLKNGETKKSQEKIEHEIREKLEQEFRKKNEEKFKKQAEREIKTELKQKYIDKKDIRSYFVVKLNKKELRNIGIIAVGIAITLVIITFVVGFITASQIAINKHGDSQIFNIETGFPLSFVNISRNKISLPPAIVISNLVNLIVDFILYFGVIFGTCCVAETIWKNKKTMRPKI